MLNQTKLPKTLNNENSYRRFEKGKDILNKMNFPVFESSYINRCCKTLENLIINT